MVFISGLAGVFPTLFAALPVSLILVAGSAWWVFRR
ncbi:MAG: hypothetical protein JWQ72_1157 [Polaromonas sp.]|nr:hypothetical protein [Polaromonas sp.]